MSASDSPGHGSLTTARGQADELARYHDDLHREIAMLKEALRPFASTNITRANLSRGYISWRVPVEWVEKAQVALEYGRRA